MTPEGWRHKHMINDGDYELIIMIRGEIFIAINGEQIAVKAHDCLLIPPHVKHCGYQGAIAGSTHYWFHFFPNGPVAVNADSNPSAEPIANQILLPQLFHLDDFEKAVLIIRQMLDSANSHHSSYLATDYFTTSVVIELADQFRAQQLRESTQNRLPAQMESLINWIRIHSHEKLSVQRVADEFHLSPLYLTKLFKKYRQTSTIHYINQVKIKEAQELLLTTNQSIKQVAFEMGYQSEKYFMRQFKQFVGVSPLHFKNSNSHTYLNNLEVDPPIPKPEHP